MSEEHEPLISNDELKRDSKGGSTFNANVRDSPDTASLPIGSGQFGGDAPDQFGGGHGKEFEADRCRYNPWLNRILEHPTSNLDTMIHLLKGNIGTGILAMPDAFRNSGWLVGIFGTMFMAVVSTHCMHMLVNCAQELCRKVRVPALGFANVAEIAFETGPVPLKPYSKLARLLVNSFLVITQLGFCCVYLVFVATNLQEFIGHYFFWMRITTYLMLLLPPLILLNFIKSLKYLTPASLTASLLTMSGLGITFFYLLQGLPRTSTVRAFAPISSLPLYFGTAIYAFEGISLVLPLESNMATPQDFGGKTGVLNTGMMIVACLYVGVGFFGYLKYGDAVKVGSITLNLPSTEILAQSVRLCMAISILLSYSLQFYVPMNIIWPKISQKFDSEQAKVRGEYAIRVLLVLFTFMLAAAIPNLSAVISLVGSVSSSMLALIFPPIIELITFWDCGISRTMFVKDVCIALFGILGFLAGTYTSIENILSY